MGKLSVTVGYENADFTGNSNIALQAAVDYVAGLGGGIVNILDGIYLMQDSLHLRSYVQVRGQKDRTILKKAPSVSSPVDGYMGYGHYDVSVKEPEKFKPGMGVYIHDDRGGGFYTTVATINRIDSNILRITGMLNSDINIKNNAVVDSVFPVISGYHLTGTSIEDLVIDGNKAENVHINGCRGGGVFLYQAHDVNIKNVKVHDFNGEGISFQQCRNTIVEDCECLDNEGNGLHPGSGSIGTVMRNVVCKGNGLDGLYYCLRVSFSLCEGCAFVDNMRNGISIGHRDEEAIIRSNKIGNNDKYGIYVRSDVLNRSGHRTIIEKNTFLENKLGEIFIDSFVKDFYVLNNKFTPLKGSAIYLNTAVSNMVTAGNDKTHNNLIDYADRSFAEGVVYDVTGEVIKTGPNHIPEGADYHLSKLRD